MKETMSFPECLSVCVLVHSQVSAKLLPDCCRCSFPSILSCIFSASLQGQTIAPVPHKISGQLAHSCIFNEALGQMANRKRKRKKKWHHQQLSTEKTKRISVDATMLCYELEETEPKCFTHICCCLDSLKDVRNTRAIKISGHAAD